MDIRVQQAAFGAGAELDAFTAGADGAGAVVSFSGIVRDDSGTLREMMIEHYPGMTEAALEKIAQEAVARWDLADVLVIHRHGRMAPGEQIMMVATAARHRQSGFRGGGVSYGLPEIPRALLEARTRGGWHILGRRKG